MKSIFDFLRAALPWIVIGLALAVFFARSAEKKKKEEKTGDYGALGMSLGMCLGAAIGAAFDNNSGIGISLGMLIGLTIGGCIKKESNDEK